MDILVKKPLGVLLLQSIPFQPWGVGAIAQGVPGQGHPWGVFFHKLLFLL